MSEIRVNNIIDEAGTGAPTFPNGATGNLTGNVTGTATTATALSGTPNITVGTVTGTDATFSGNLTVQGTTTTIDTAVTEVDSLQVDGSVAIGNTDPSLYHNATNGLVVARGGTNEGITIDCSNQAGIFFSNGSNGAVDINGQLLYYHTSNDESMRMIVDGSERMRINDDSIVSTVPFSDSIGPLRRLGINSHNAATYTLVAGDAGKLVREATNGANITIPQNVFTAGDMISIFNVSGGDNTITQGTGTTLYNTADGATGNRTLAAKGVCTIVCTDTNEFIISGSQVS